jgi:hypothetical protein
MAGRERPVPVRQSLQLELPLAVDGEPTRPARWVASAAGVPLHRVVAAIDAGELPARYDGQQWQVPLWAIPAFQRGVE